MWSINKLLSLEVPCFSWVWVLELSLKGEEVRIDFGRVFGRCFSLWWGWTMRGWSCGLSLLPGSGKWQSHCCYMKIIITLLKVFTDAKCKPSLFHRREQPHHALLSNPWSWYSKHPPGHHWKSLDKLCSHQEVWWGITLLWKVQFVLKMLSLAWPVFPEVLFCCWMFCLFLKPFISHLQFLEMKILNQCSKWRRVTSHRGG